MATTIKVPVDLKAKLLLWMDVSYHDMEEINKLQSIPDLESALCSVFGVDLPEPKRRALLELYVQTVLFCRELKFNNEQTSALLSIIKSIHEANVETPLNNIKQCFKYCKELLLCHSVRRPPHSINLFSAEEVNCILQYIINSYLRHCRLYKYIFTPEVKLDLSLTYSEIPKRDDPTLDSCTTPASAENVTEKDAEATAQMDGSPEMQEELEWSAPGSKSELKALIEKEVREQMALVSGRLDQQLKEFANRQNRASESHRGRYKTKK